MMHEEFGSHLMGILWTGSRVYGRVYAHSDWDFFVIHDEGWRQRRLLTLDGSEVEVFINPPEQIRLELSWTDHPATIAMFARGVVVDDRDGLVQSLADQARLTWNQGPPLVEPGSMEFWRYAVCDLLKDVADRMADDPNTVSWLASQVVQTAMTGHYKWHRHWLPKPKYLLDDLSAWDPSLATMVRQVFQPGVTRDLQYEALQSLVRAVLKPFDGCPSHWESMPQAIQT